MTKEEKQRIKYLLKIKESFKTLHASIDSVFEKHTLKSQIVEQIRLINNEIRALQGNKQEEASIGGQEKQETPTNNNTDKENVPQISQNIPEAVIAAARTVLGILGNVLGKGIFAQGEQLFTPAKEAQGQLAQLVGDGNTDTNIG